MTTITDHPLSYVLRNAHLGNFPAADGRVEVLGPLPGPCDALIHFTDHLIVATDLSEHWVQRQLDSGWAGSDDPGSQLIYFLGAITEALGRPPTASNTLVAAPYTPAWLHGTLTEGGAADSGWARYRTDIRSYRYESMAGTGTVSIGRGPAGRWDVFVRIDTLAHGPSARLGRELLRAGKTLIPEGAGLFGSAPMHDPRALRTILGAGFQPVATEVLFAKQ